MKLTHTIIYCFLTHLLTISYGPALGIFLILIGFLKGYLSHAFSNFLNLEKAKVLYKKNGFKDSVLELLSLVLIYLNSIIIDYEKFTLFEYLFLFVGFALVYRFLFWGITRTIREKDENIFTKN